MGRGRYPARLHVSPPPPELAERYLLTWPGRELYTAPERFPPIASPALFGDDRPLELDIGCATGEFVCALARERPEANYLGADIVAKPLWKAVERAADLGLTNARFLHADMHVAARQIPPGSLRAAYLHFPAPLLRNRQRRQRLVEPELLGRVAAGLAAGGAISVLTDHEPLYAELLAVLPAVPALRLRPADERSAALGALIKSHYHRRWEERGRTIFRAELEKAG